MITSTSLTVNIVDFLVDHLSPSASASLCTAYYFFPRVERGCICKMYNT